MATKRRYSDDDRANALAALAANGGNVFRTGKQLDIPEATLRQWANGDRHPEATQMSEEKKELLADACERVAWKLLSSIDEDHKSAPLGQRSTAFGTIIDKMRLLRGESTADVTSGGKPLEHRNSLERLAARFGDSLAESPGDAPPAPSE